ncbi:AfsR/SARP family transcriptional regulator [Allorhizocola rhizosphaerae]|uniref:AfsR/SARP family transcriptional regulator n=1 Tax=Allorhizocola rhizosphaerae TaxID=1872709 RepID=UPI001B8B5DE0|nr:tetratricopeptide repeat protein [Allorhizocola rhizosphaerae]
MGPIAAYTLDGEVDLGPTRQRTVLAALLVEQGAPVTLEQLVDRVWGERPPQRARQTLHTYLSRLRTLLERAGGTTPVRRGGGYVLAADPATVDLHLFRSLVTEARAADDEAAVALWREALALWRGAPFDGLESDWLATVAAGLERERWAAILDRNEVLLRRGEHTALLVELSAACDEHPLHERLAGQLMLALYAGGGQADALAHYRKLRERLVEEVGSEPGPALQELHQRILRHDPQLIPAATDAAVESSHSPAARPHRPAQLPADASGFTGRDPELRKLDALLLGNRSSGRASQAVVIAAIAGTAGVGKTALAVHWAHRVADRFPDGQLYLNLRGYSPDQPMTPADALAHFLTALGVTGQNIPLGLEERAARFRSEVAEKRMLIVLDNAASVRQVRTLLPGSASCLVVVTSRDKLAGLVAVDGAYRLDLELLTTGEAVTLLGGLIGARTRVEPEATAALAEQCARLPLALRIAAELAVSHPDRALADLSAELNDRQSRLELLDAGGDPYAAVREVFSWSIQHLPSDALDTFRHLGLHPGPDLDPYAVAALTGTSVREARHNLASLASAHLVHRSGADRYTLHDLLRAYATGLATGELAGGQRENALRRLLDYFRTAAGEAMDCLHPAEARHRPARVPSDLEIPDLAVPDAARAWLDAERFCLIAVAAHAAAEGDHEYVVDLARTAHRYLIDAHLTEAIALSGHARRAGEQAHDPVALAQSLRQLGAAYSRMSRFELAIDYQREALAQAQRGGDLLTEALVRLGLGVALSHSGRTEEAVEETRKAIDIARRAGDPLGEAMALNNLSICEMRLGRYPEAGDHQRLALTRFRELGARPFQANALTNLAVIETRLGRLVQAAGHFDESLAILRELSTPIVEAHTLDKLGILLLRLGDAPAAVAKFQRALDLFRRIGVPAAEGGSLNGLGEAACISGQFTEALDHHRRALAIAEEVAALDQQARAHVGIGRALCGLNTPDRARAHYERAIELYSGQGRPEADDVRMQLAALDETQKVRT